MAEFLQRYRVAFSFLLFGAALAGIVAFYALKPRDPVPLLLSLTPASPEATPTPGPIRVYISGAVRSPDVYSLPAGSIVKDALLAAGGASTDADLDRVNLAQALAEGQHVYIPRLGEEAPPVQVGTRAGGPAKVNINSATPAELEALPGIGPVTAQHIVDYRQAHGPFQAIEDIQQVPGIGPATFEKIRDRITTR